jgi:hypothetical protein
MCFPPPALALIRVTPVRTADIVGIAQRRAESVVFASKNLFVVSGDSGAVAGNA